MTHEHFCSGGVPSNVSNPDRLRNETCLNAAQPKPSHTCTTHGRSFLPGSRSVSGMKWMKRA